MGATSMAVTWWGHSFATVELPGGRRVATDPLMTRVLLHLRRDSPAPPPEAARADVVLISHLHHDHLHLPSLRQFAPGTPIVVPRGAVAAVPGLADFAVTEVDVGDHVTIAGVDVEVLPAAHDGRRDRRPRAPRAPAIGFRYGDGGGSCWFPGDTAPADFTAVEPVDLALVPIGGWGASLPESHHLDPVGAVTATAQVGAAFVVPVHYGTFWPWMMRRGSTAHRHYFEGPAERFVEAAGLAGLTARVVIPPFGSRVLLRQEG